MKFLPVLVLSCSVLRAEPPALPTVSEALARAQLLHATIEGTLRIMHRDFFHKGDNKAIPSESLKDVFKALAVNQGITVRWLASPQTIMNVDNKAKDDFETAALKTITTGGKEVTAVENGTFRFVGPIALENRCLKCHVNDRTSLEDRFAGLEISLPVQPPAAKQP